MGIAGNDGFSRIAIKGVEGGKSTTRSQVDLAAHSNRKEVICVICCQSYNFVDNSENPRYAG